MNANPKQKSPTRQHATSLWPGLARILQCSLLTTALLGLAGSGQAAGIFDYGTTAPTAGTYDVLQAVSVSGNGPGGNYYVNNGNPPGQTFTTGNHSSGYQLSTIYVQEDSGGGGNQANDAYTLYFYSVSGTSQTLLSSYVTTNTLTVGTGHWIYISGLTNSLLANTTYGFGLVDNSGRYWRLANTSANPYAGGTACLFSTTAGARTIPTIDSSADAAFDVVLVGNPDPFVSSTIITPVNPVYAGSPVTLTAAYGGTGPFSFQWLQNSGTGFTNLAGSVTNTYSLNTTTMPAGSYQYELIVTGADG